VLFPKRFWAGLSDGSVTVAFRRQRRPTAKAGGTLQSPGGLLAIDEVAVINTDEITDEDARAAGYADHEDAIANLRPDGEGYRLYRFRFHRAGDDPRVALRADDQLDRSDMATLAASLARLEWAVPTLRLIAARPGEVSTQLAPALGMERFAFKQRVRRLKAMGLTESLRVGYRLSPRGQAFLAQLDAG
jgi:hypothetical protein